MLSKGWSRGLAGIAGGLWLTSFGLLLNTLNAEFLDGMDNNPESPKGFVWNMSIILMCVFTPVPLLIALDGKVASVSCLLVPPRSKRSSPTY